MKRNKIFLLLMLGFLFSCSNQGELKHEHFENARQEKQEHEQALTLNKGSKWVLDENTRSNIATLQAMLQGPITGKNIAALGPNLQIKTDKLLKECRMKGPDHDALHAWLETYLAHLKQFNDPSADKYKAYSSIQNDLEKFNEYFE